MTFDFHVRTRGMLRHRILSALAFLPFLPGRPLRKRLRRWWRALKANPSDGREGQA